MLEEVGDFQISYADSSFHIPSEFCGEVRTQDNDILLIIKPGVFDVLSERVDLLENSKSRGGLVGGRDIWLSG